MRARMACLLAHQMALALKVAFEAVRVFAGHVAQAAVPTMG
jgi:hypothetical protein